MVDAKLKMMAAQTALKDMLSDKSFSICTVDKIIEMLGRHPDPSSYKVLSTLHCIKYRDMPTELLQRLPDLLCNCLGEGSRPAITDCFNGLKLTGS